MTLSVLVMDAGPSELAGLLGPDGAVALQAHLSAAALAWAQDVAPGSVLRADGGSSLADAVARGFIAGSGPLVVVWPSLPRLRHEHADAALDDLAAGCDVAFGPLMGGGFYLLGLSRPLPDVVAALDGTGDTTPAGLAAAGEGGLEIGYLQPERGLRTEADVAAALADPLTPPEIRALLS